MFLDALSIPFLSDLVRDKEKVFTEYEAAKKSEPAFGHFLNSATPEFTNHTKYWLRENHLDAQQTGYDLRTGIWGAFPLYKKGFPVKWYPVEERFPHLSEFFEKNDRIEFACFMRLEGGKRVETHAHARQHLIFHMLMHDLDGKGCEFTCGEEKTSLKRKGDFLLFDYSYPHGSHNYASADRINLVIDLKM